MQLPASTYGETESEEVALVFQKGSGGGLKLGKKKPVRQQEHTEVCVGIQGGLPGPWGGRRRPSLTLVNRSLGQLVLEDRQEADRGKTGDRGILLGWRDLKEAPGM